MRFELPSCWDGMLAELVCAAGGDGRCATSMVPQLFDGTVYGTVPYIVFILNMVYTAKYPYTLYSFGKSGTVFRYIYGIYTAK